MTVNAEGYGRMQRKPWHRTCYVSGTMKLTKAEVIALAELIKLVESGVEYPTAIWRVSKNLNDEQWRNVERAYDAVNADV